MLLNLGGVAAPRPSELQQPGGHTSSNPAALASRFPPSFLFDCQGTCVCDRATMGSTTSPGTEALDPGMRASREKPGTVHTQTSDPNWASMSQGGLEALGSWTVVPDIRWDLGLQLSFMHHRFFFGFCHC